MHTPISLSLSAAGARQAFAYCPQNGKIHFRSSGKIAGTLTHVGRERRYWVLKVKGRTIYCHRLAWLLMTGEWPLNDVDHIDGDGSNNQWDNLRSATRSQNLFNRRAQANNTSGFKGVHRFRNKWHAQIRANGKRYHLGFFVLKEDAAAAYAKAAARLHADFRPTGA